MIDESNMNKRPRLRFTRRMPSAMRGGTLLGIFVGLVLGLAVGLGLVVLPAVLTVNSQSEYP